MKINHKLAIAFVAFGSLFAFNASASCVSGMKSQTPSQRATLDRLVQSFKRIKAASAASAQTLRREDAPASKPTMAGMWMTTFTVDGQVVDAGFDVWHSDGSQILNDNPPPAAGNVCLGIWEQTSDFTYSLKHPSWSFDDSGNLIGIGYILERVTLDPSGNSYTGTFVIEGFDLDGNDIYHAEGLLSGDRITVTSPLTSTSSN